MSISSFSTLIAGSVRSAHAHGRYHPSVAPSVSFSHSLSQGTSPICLSRSRSTAIGRGTASGNFTASSSEQDDSSAMVELILHFKELVMRRMEGADAQEEISEVVWEIVERQEVEDEDTWAPAVVARRHAWWDFLGAGEKRAVEAEAVARLGRQWEEMDLDAAEAVREWREAQEAQEAQRRKKEWAWLLAERDRVIAEEEEEWAERHRRGVKEQVDAYRQSVLRSERRSVKASVYQQEDLTHLPANQQTSELCSGVSRIAVDKSTTRDGGG